MDRTSFLKAQPFLFPLESVAWPPPLPAETTERRGCRRETLLRDFFLSIEPFSGSSEDSSDRLSQQSIYHSAGPAFFAKPKSTTNAAAEKKASDNADADGVENNDSFDASMAPLELAVQTATITIPPEASPGRGVGTLSSSFSNRFTSPTAYHKLLRRQRKQSSAGDAHKLVQLRESTVFLQIQSQVYQMDLSQVENVDVQLEENALTTEDESAGSRPPSLLIQFGNICLFRIFSLTGVTADNVLSLKNAQNLLLQILTAENHVPAEFPSNHFISGMTSPAGSSSTTIFSSSGEPGQQDFTRRTAVNGTPPSSGSNTKPKASAREGDGASSLQQKMDESPGTVAGASQQFAVARKRLASHARSKRDLEELQDILMQNPLPATERVSAKRVRLLQEQVQNLCASIPANLSASYSTRSQLQVVFEHQKERIQGYEKEMDALVKSYWPTPVRNNRGGLSRQSSFDRRPQVPAGECIERANQLLQQYKQAVQEQLDLSLLPTRGS